ncbi:hypothetical protein AK830_g7532 [Neonectria ditissima]|uniref:DUF967 domain protein n=1 Tax=Neonectria ditissima TaxID=78410 RepID=A0A0N8H6I0_9HYPO|nr:hypothetical protein AK830_g7532 [Neonectria ditissima]
MEPKVFTRQSPPGSGLQKAAQALQSSNGSSPPITGPPTDVEGRSLTFSSFTTEDALELGHLLLARLLPIAKERPAVISISLANSGQVVFQSVTGSGIVPDNEHWLRRKRNTVLRFGLSTWFMHCKFKGDEEAFAAKFAIGDEKKGDYAIHGGAVPIHVHGVEGVVAVVIVSGLKQHEDHGVIFDVVKENWK